MEQNKHIFVINDDNRDHFIIAFICDVMHDHYTTRVLVENVLKSHTVVPHDQFQLICEAAAIGCSVPPLHVADLVIRALRIPTNMDFPNVDMYMMERALQTFVMNKHMPEFDGRDNGETYMSDTCRSNRDRGYHSACKTYESLPLYRRLIATPTIVDPGFIAEHVDYDMYHERRIHADTTSMEFIVAVNDSTSPIGAVLYTKSGPGFVVNFFDHIIDDYKIMSMDSVKKGITGYLKNTHSRDIRDNVPYMRSRQQLFDRLFLVFMFDFAQLMYAQKASHVTVVTNDVAMTACAMMLLNSNVVSDMYGRGHKLTAKPTFIIPPRVPVSMPL